MAKVLILYYATYGHIETLANAIAEGARGVAGSDVTIKRVSAAGDVRVNDAALAARDGLAIDGEPQVTITVETNSGILLADLPPAA